MPVPAELRPIAQQINKRLNNLHGFYRFRTGTRPYWFERMLTELVILVEGDDVEYITGRHESTDAEVVVVTGNRIVRSVASEIAAGNATVVSEAWSRNRVATVRASANEPAFGGDQFADWPGRLSVQLGVIDGPQFSLPLERSSSDERDEDNALRIILRKALVDLS